MTISIWEKLSDSEILTEDGTPVSDLKAEIVELKAEVQGLKKQLQQINWHCNVSGTFYAKSRRKIQDLSSR